MIDLVMNAFESAVKIVAERDKKRIEKLIKHWSENNSNIAPNMDARGRLHAPCDGYVLPEALDFVSDYSEKIFAKGQYLPRALSGDEERDDNAVKRSNAMKERFKYRHKIKIEEELAIEILKELDKNSFIELGKGKSWKVNDKNICYLYLSGNESFVKIFAEKIENSIKNDEKQVYSGEGIEGRQRVSGNVRFLREVYLDTVRGVSKSIQATIVLDNDSVTYGNLPSSLMYEIKVGDNVEFTATFTKSQKNTFSSSYKRPLKMIKIDETV